MMDMNELQNLVEDILASNLPTSTGCDFEVIVDDDLVPYINVSTPDDDISVVVTTDEVEEDGVVVGFQFTPIITNSECEFHLNFQEGSESPISKYRTWLEVAEFCKAIAETEIYPDEYVD